MRRETNDVAARNVVWDEWGENKRRLGTMGRDGRGQLMPSWSTVAKLPLYKVKAQLKRCSRVARSRVLRGGQRTLDGFVVRRARTASALADLAGGDEAAPAAKRDCTDSNANYEGFIGFSLVKTASKPARRSG